MSRTRTMGAISRGWYRVQEYNPSGALTSDVTTFHAGGANGKVESITDVVIKDFQSRKNKGEVFMNPVSLSKDTRSSDVVTYTIGPHPNWGRRVITGTLGQIASIPPVVPAWFDVRINDAKARTLLEAHSRVAASEVQGLVSVAEAAKTASMVAKPFAQATDLISRIVGRKLKLIQRGWNAAKAGAAAWNEYRFGWKPILLDLKGAADAYAQSTTAEWKPVRKVARASDRDIVWVEPNKMSYSGSFVFGVPTVVRSNYSHTAKVDSGVLYELYDETQASATARLIGFRLSDVPSTIWELVPFSFVVDRFLDIGMWLNAIVPKPGVRVLATWTSVQRYQLNYHQIMWADATVSTPPVTTYTNTGGSYTEEIRSFSREANPSIPPLPTVNYRDLSLTQQIDHLALIVAKLGGLKVRS